MIVRGPFEVYYNGLCYQIRTADNRQEVVCEVDEDRPRASEVANMVCDSLNGVHYVEQAMDGQPDDDS